MVSTTDYPRKSGLLANQDAVSERPKKRRFRLFAALAAPFQDMDERALHKKRKHVAVQNNSKGNMYTSRAPAPIGVPIRRFQSSGD
jgi:hypothetical protein